MHIFLLFLTPTFRYLYNYIFKSFKNLEYYSLYIVLASPKLL